MNSAYVSAGRIQGLPAIIDRQSTVLILGTLPGQLSLTSGKYYADPSNKFWDILFTACGEKVEKPDEAKEALLKKYHIALWDVLESAVREGSSDKDLKDPRPNDLPRCFDEYPNLRLLIFHSNRAYKYFKHYFINPAIPYICVPSPSGQSRNSIQEKILAWRAALSFVIPQLQGDSRLTWKNVSPM